MKNANILRTVKGLRAHVRDRLRRNPDADEQQVVHRFLAALDLTATDHRAILDEYWRQELGVRDKSMTENEIVQTIVVLEYCVSEKLRQNPDASEKQLVHDHLAALNLEPTQLRAILHEYRRLRSGSSNPGGL
jgi:hypothetical protein